MKLYMTETARKSAIDNINNKIEVLAHTDIDYMSYREICNYLTQLKEIIIRENEECKKNNK